MRPVERRARGDAEPIPAAPAIELTRACGQPANELAEQRGQRTPSGQRAASNQARHAASERNLPSRPGSVQSFMTTIYRTAPAHQNRVQQDNNSGSRYQTVAVL